METVLIGGRLIDGTGQEPQQHVGLVIKDGLIQQVDRDDRLSHAAGARIIDVEGRTIMPGLIDSHTHLTYHAQQLDLWQLELQESVELNAIKASLNALRVLEMGFTTIGDGGCRGFIGPAVRDAVNQGLVLGPRIVATGPILCGSAGLQDNMPAWMELESDAALGMIVNGPTEVRRAVRRQIKGGVDWIKVSASGVAGSRFSHAETEDLTYEEVVAAVQEAAKFGKKVHAHAHAREAIKTCALAGVLSLHSAEYVDEEGLELMRRHGVIFAPTIAWLHARGLPGYFLAKDPEFVVEARRAFESAAAAVAHAREVGARIAIGTDAAHRFFHVPDGVLEMEFFVHLGYTPLEVITAATKTAAEAIDRGDILGTLEPGKRGDVLIIDRDPAEDIRVLRDKRNIHRQLIDGLEVVLPGPRPNAGLDFDVREALGSHAVAASRVATGDSVSP